MSVSPGGDKRSVLPPIVFEKDKRFLESVQRYILTEIEKVGCTEQGPPEQYYIIYRNAFDKIIEYVTAYKNILISIKQEYETFIATIKNVISNNAFSSPTGLSIEESLNLDALSKHLAQLDRKMLELKKEREIKYIPWKKKMELEQELLCLLALRDTAEAEREKLKLRYKCISAIYSHFYFRYVPNVT
uniref:Translin-associated factor X-interacting protein 1 N-terminal domain-containing protein n=1 Tax=Apteryx owenii TaxID=8824 RepID=A0A8B9PZJ1_APTOW